ncbi:hypothetical protein [uncultured Tenacibaculum sp.]|uniref:hypothetical protein n=1 Tax=uncultured Tenacibaculum sp. TaxID=174713 RepID=UPI0026016FCB|nr:hypothetical protein [uncultured Tenacibaculum sp.]
MNRLQKSLLINAIFSGVSGFILILFYNSTAKVFQLNNNNVFWIIGLILLYFMTTIFYEIKKQRKIAVLWIIIQDFLWVIASCIILITNLFQISNTGNIIISVIALIVLFMGLNQFFALKTSCK